MSFQENFTRTTKLLNLFKHTMDVLYLTFEIFLISSLAAVSVPRWKYGRHFFKSLLAELYAGFSIWDPTSSFFACSFWPVVTVEEDELSISSVRSERAPPAFHRTISVDAKRVAVADTFGRT